MAKKKKNSEIFTSILYIVIGVLFVIFQSKTMEWLMTASGIVFIISGALDLLKRKWVGGAVSAAIGVLTIFLGWKATQIVLIIFGILIALRGLVALIEAIQYKKNVLAIIFPALSIALGLLLAFGNGINVMIIVVGVLLIADGALGVVGSVLKK